MRKMQSIVRALIVLLSVSIACFVLAIDEEPTLFTMEPDTEFAFVVLVSEAPATGLTAHLRCSGVPGLAEIELPGGTVDAVEITGAWGAFDYALPTGHYLSTSGVVSDAVFRVTSESHIGCMLLLHNDSGDEFSARALVPVSAGGTEFVVNTAALGGNSYFEVTNPGPATAHVDYLLPGSTVVVGFSLLPGEAYMLRMDTNLSGTQVSSTEPVLVSAGSTSGSLAATPAVPTSTWDYRVMARSLPGVTVTEKLSAVALESGTLRSHCWNWGRESESGSEPIEAHTPHEFTPPMPGDSCSISVPGPTPELSGRRLLAGGGLAWWPGVGSLDDSSNAGFVLPASNYPSLGYETPGERHVRCISRCSPLTATDSLGVTYEVVTQVSPQPVGYVVVELLGLVDPVDPDVTIPLDNSVPWLIKGLSAIECSVEYTIEGEATAAARVTSLINSSATAHAWVSGNWLRESCRDNGEERERLRFAFVDHEPLCGSYYRFVTDDPAEIAGDDPLSYVPMPEEGNPRSFSYGPLGVEVFLEWESECNSDPDDFEKIFRKAGD